MADEALRTGRAPSWAGSLGCWLLAWLIVSIAIVASALLAALFGMSLTPQPAPPEGGSAAETAAMVRMTAATLPVVIGASAAAALLAGLPLQVVALQVRRRGEGSRVFAIVAVLSCFSAILSFAVLQWRYAVYGELLQPSTLFLTTVLAGFYLIHVVILHVARSLTSGQKPVSSAT